MTDTVKTKVGLGEKERHSNESKQSENEKRVKKQEMAKTMNKMGNMGADQELDTS